MRAALPQLRQQGRGLVLWVSSSSARGGTLPYLSPYFAAKAATDSLIVPGALTEGTKHFAQAGKPADTAREDAYDKGPYAGLPEQSLQRLAALEPADADVDDVAKAIVDSVEKPFGTRPFRVHIDPSEHGCEIVDGVADRIRAEMFRRMGLDDLLHPRAIG